MKPIGLAMDWYHYQRRMFLDWLEDVGFEIQTNGFDVKKGDPESFSKIPWSKPPRR